jgi:hypothetical protein
MTGEAGGMDGAGVGAASAPAPVAATAKVVASAVMAPRQRALRSVEVSKPDLLID